MAYDYSYMPYSPRMPQKVVIPPGTLSPDENTVLDLPQDDEEIFVATKPKGQRPATSSKPRPNGEKRSVPEPPHTPHSLMTVGPEPAELETREQENFEDDLKSFQQARRKLLYDVLTLQIVNLKKSPKPHPHKQ